MEWLVAASVRERGARSHWQRISVNGVCDWEVENVRARDRGIVIGRNLDWCN
jgi:hypothetical protein